MAAQREHRELLSTSLESSIGPSPRGGHGAAAPPLVPPRRDASRPPSNPSCVFSTPKNPKSSPPPRRCPHKSPIVTGGGTCRVGKGHGERRIPRPLPGGQNFAFPVRSLAAAPRHNGPFLQHRRGLRPWQKCGRKSRACQRSKAPWGLEESPEHGPAAVVPVGTPWGLERERGEGGLGLPMGLGEAPVARREAGEPGVRLWVRKERPVLQSCWERPG